VLVSGYSGIGKSSVVNELHKVLVPRRGLFASGKFDQYKRDIPYATLVQAFRELTRSLLGKSEAELARWRDALREALEPNGRLMVDLVPELELIVGEQPAVPELSPQDAQRRFQFVLRRFIGTFARPEHPLTLFLDDLQWLDAATLDLLEDVLTRSDLRHLMLIGAYRDNEVSAAHPLMLKLETIRNAGTPVQEVKLAPLAREDVGELIADALRCERARIAPLAELVYEKTAGNPFFLIQFIHALLDEGLLAFDHRAEHWSWDLERIHAKGYTSNVADLMVGKLTPPAGEDAGGAAAARLPGDQRQHCDSCARARNVRGAGARGPGGGGSPGADRAPRERLQFRARPYPGNRNRAAPRRKFDGIRQEIVEDEANFAAIGAGGEILDVDVETHALRHQRQLLVFEH